MPRLISEHHGDAHDAIQWDGQSLDELPDWVHEADPRVALTAVRDSSVAEGDELLPMLPLLELRTTNTAHNGRRERFAPGDWLVHLESGDVLRLTDEHFRERFDSPQDG
jgi:hypothetical protein